MNERPRRPGSDDPPDLQTQLEGILDAVWASEEEWRLDDRISLSISVERVRREGTEEDAPDASER
jgi:hypothetical protein